MNRGNMIIAVVLISIVGVGILGYWLVTDEPAAVVIDENATFTGWIEHEQDTRYHSIRVYENVTRIHFILKCPMKDFDLYGRLGQLPSRSYNDFSGIASGGENFYYDFPEQGIYHLMVYSYSGTGHCDLIIEYEYD
ncbi:MAG: hypothetical protein RTV72_13905 [Candidatus Thorarchaeota archaeon]